MKHTNLHQELEAVRKRYNDTLEERLRNISTLWQELKNGEWDSTKLKELHFLVHKLAGSGGTFGHPGISEKARILEQIFVTLLKEQKKASKKIRVKITRLIESLIKGEDIFVQGKAQYTPPDLRTHLKPGLKIYLVEDDTVLADEIALQLKHFGYHVEIFHDLSSAEKQLNKHAPAAIIMDIVFPEGDLAGPELLEDLRAKTPLDIPVLFISVREDFDARLSVVRARGSAYFVKPLNVGALVDRLDALLVKEIPAPYQVLIVDENQQQAIRYKRILESAGMTVNVVHNPKEIFTILGDSRPDLMLLNTNMATCSGLELSTLIHQHENFVSLPIVYLASQADFFEQATARQVGGDDFLFQSLDDEQLAAAVTARVKRSRLLQSIIERDSLTGLLKHTAIKDQLAAQLSIGRRRAAPFGYCMIDIDHFKAVNDTYGHLAGDRLIKTLARILRQRLRKSDIIGRYGGEEFAIIFPDISARVAAGVVDEIRQDFEKIIHYADNGSFSVTFSAGIAAFPDYSDVDALITAADNALYKAKQTGRNRICTY